MDKLYDTGKQLINNSWFLWGTTLTIAFLALAKSYFKGGVCRIKRDLSGKVIVITGGNAGIGQATIEQLSQSKCTIIFGARDVRKSEEAIRSIKQKNKDADITFYPLDLADTKSILEFSSRVRKQVQHIDILVNNAAVFLLPQLTHTKQGYEMHMGVNHLGHFYLTYLLWPLIQQAHKPRIINVSALAHRGFKFPHNTNIPIEFDDLHLTNSYDPMLAYSRSKIANILFTKELQRRMDAANFEGFSYCLHPGVVRTQITRNVSWGFKLMKALFYPLTFLIMKSANEGAQTTLYTIHQNENRLVKGGYYSDCQPSWVSQFAGSMENAQKLWELSEQELQISFRL